jgi:hypothetical protein
MFFFLYLCRHRALHPTNCSLPVASKQIGAKMVSELAAGFSKWP